MVPTGPALPVTIFMILTLTGRRRKHIAFSSMHFRRHNIYVMNADGSNPVRLTRGFGLDWLPDWSPDGRRIAYSSQGRIVVMDADGSNQTLLTDQVGKDFCPAWSPDGSLIAFDSFRHEDGEIYVMNSDGSNQVRLTYNPAERK
jgi:TolB protein